jgi:hypothetical protein
MNKTSSSAPRTCARLTAGLALASSAFAGLIAATAAPASAHPTSALAVARSVTAAPQRAFFGLGPASKTKIDGRPFFSWSATPGSQFTDYVAIVDFGTTPVTLQVFATNAVSVPGGGTGFVARGKAVGGPASWITLRFPHGSSTLHLAPRSKVIVPILVRIPRNAPPGDHEGAIIASLTSTIVSKHHIKVHFVQQVAARVVARISGKLHPQLSILGLRVAYDDPLNPLASGAATLRFTVKNTGNVLLGGHVTVSVHGLLGSTETRANVVTVPILLPGGSVTARETVDGVYPEFFMDGKVVIVPTIVTGQYDVGLTDYSAQTSFLAIPWILLAIVVLLVAGGVWYWRRRRRRRLVAAHARGRGRKTQVLVED